ARGPVRARGPSRAEGGASLVSDPRQTADAPCTPWPEWQAFKRLYVSDDGRVVDASTPQAVTVSEAQPYALTFARVANDPASFAKILSWTRDNLSTGDPARVLPAWRWGKA